jgi:Niemann-Pick C1 protein
MTFFSCFYFYRKNRLQSRCLLGFASVVSVLVSIMTGYGLLFIIGVPFTSMTQLIPFIIFGIGLDDAFMITDTYERTDTNKTPEDRIYDTIEECGFSITLTTITSTLSFGIGISSSIPAINWLCLYACPTIAIVLLYQVTFYVACVVLDERRVQNRRLDVCLCYQIKDYQFYAKQIYDYNKSVSENKNISNRLMNAYSEFILRPKMRVFIITSFIALVGLCAWSATKLTQEFDIKEVLPSDSFISDYLDAATQYNGQGSTKPSVYFRNEDFSGEYVQGQMEKFINDLVDMKTVNEQPTHFWLRDFRIFRNMTDLSNYTFNDQLQLFLKDPIYNDRYVRDMAFSSDGTLLASRCQLKMDGMVGNVKASINALREQEAVTIAQPINHGKSELSFFTFAVDYNSWSFYDSCVQQLRQSTLSGIGSVTAAALLFIPHWTAAFIVCPIVCMMYVDILGVLQWANIHINAVSFVTVVMSIGLIVDYLLHILLRYYETPGCRIRRTSEALSTVGVSVFAGGFSTLLGTMPLVLSTSQIFWTVFVAFVTLVSVALAHGLIFLPVVLGSFGPTDNPLSKHSDSQGASSALTSIVSVSQISRNGRIERRMSL